MFNENDSTEVELQIIIEVDYDIVLDMIQHAFEKGKSVDQIIDAIVMFGINGFTDSHFEEDRVVLIRIISEAISRKYL